MCATNLEQRFSLIHALLLPLAFVTRGRSLTDNSPPVLSGGRVGITKVSSKVDDATKMMPAVVTRGQSDRPITRLETAKVSWLVYSMWA